MRILIANRALSALKFVTSIKEWLRKDIETKLTLIGLVTEEDMDSGYKYIELLDEVIMCQNGIYMDGPKITELALKNNIEAVWPGWGYLSERSDFVELLEKNNIKFVGPSSATIKQVGDKIESMKLAEKANAPLIPWSGGCIENKQEALLKGKQIGFPLMIKAADGGGGRGIRRVNKEQDLETSLDEVNAEVPGPVFLMKLMENAMHLEIQIIGDGTEVRHLYGRDCSLQRRNQKLMEEGPITIAPPEIRKKMEDGAVNIGKLVNYSGAGTVEYLYRPDTGELSFLEVNPRLQVEHIVSEIICGVNIPSLQVQIAMGKNLDQILPEKIEISRHCIAARINAENPMENFQPSTGSVDFIEMKELKNTWSYFSIGNNSKILPSVDGQFGHMFSYGEDREDARKRMKDLLALTIHGNIFNTAKFLKLIIQTPEYINQTHHTQWLGHINCKDVINHSPEQKTTDAEIAVIGTCVLAYQEFSNNWINFDMMIEKGHSPDESLLKMRLEKQVCFKNIQYDLIFWCAPQSSKIIAELGNNQYSLNLFSFNNSIYVQNQDQMYHLNVVQQNSSGTMIRINNSIYWFPVHQDPTILRTQTGGRLVRFLYENDSNIEAGQAFAEIEIMKMILKLNSKISGKLQQMSTPGQSLDPGQIIAKIVPESIDKIDKLPKYNGTLSINKATAEEQTQIRILWRNYVNRIPTLEKNIKTSKVTDKRVYCLQNNTTYIYDLFQMFNAEQEWELLMDQDMNIYEEEPKLGKNKIGMVARRMILENKLEILVIGNDITFINGSFGEEESKFYVAICKYAVKLNLPRIYISSNSGARIEVDNNLRKKFMIKWRDDKNPTKGISYLYFDQENYLKYRDKIFAKVNSEGHYVIDRILSPGVSNLDAAAWTASETVRTYNKIPTYVYVTGRSVGIGAYLCKLNERVIQKKDSPILLTGYKSLNKVLGQNLYKTNLQIGGPNIMGNNGISHKIVNTDAEGINELLKWISYQKEITFEFKDKPFDYIPSENDMNIRKIINSVLDQDSFMELQNDWAKSMIIGRGRIRGKPIGILANNTEATQKSIPVDPGDLESALKTVNQSGCLWYPDSTLKTSQALRDIDKEKMPILMFANLRGFSGGTTDMFQEILKFGAGIVQALESIENKVFIYVPPYAQLRGGAMVVLSKSICKDKIKIWADNRAHLNILEPNALKSIKFRQQHIENLLERHGLENNTKNIAAVEPSIEQFFNLHDKPECSVGVIDKIVSLGELRNNLVSELN